MDFDKYKKIRDESKREAEIFLDGLPDYFTMTHLECLKNVVTEQIEKRLSDLKEKTKLR